MTSSDLWAALIFGWVGVMVPTYFFLGRKASKENYEGPAENKFNRVMWIWITGFLSVVILWKANPEDPGFGILWTVAYLATVFFWVWRKRQSRSPGATPKQARQRAIRIIFAGAAGFIVFSLMAEELSGFVYELEGSPPYGGLYEEMFAGPIPRVVFALLALFGGYLLFSQRPEPK